MRNGTDGLTGLFDKATTMRMLEEEIKRATEKRLAFSVALVDLDFFKKLNDRLGHQKGDQLLARFAAILGKNVPAGAVVGRYGGEEFVILLPEAEKEAALIFMEDVRRLVAEKRFRVRDERGEEEVTVTFSAGIASHPADGGDAVGLLRRADNALYLAKVYGRNRVCLAMEDKMVLKSNYYTKGQLERLSRIAAEHEVTESYLLREGLDMIIDKYDRLTRARIRNMQQEGDLEFGALAALPDASIQRVLKGLEMKALVTALVKAPRGLREAVLRNMSERSAAMTREEIARARKAGTGAAEAARAAAEVAAAMNRMRAQGEI